MRPRHCPPVIIGVVYEHGFTITAEEAQQVNRLYHGVWIVFLVDVTLHILLEYKDTRRTFSKLTWVLTGLLYLTLVPVIFHRPEVEGGILDFWNFLHGKGYRLVLLLLLSLLTLSNGMVRLLGRKGPKVINEIDVTRHILRYMPEALEQGTRSVSAISPGVLGTTGIETLEVITGIVENIKPKLIIVIDALASRSIDRISSSIQLADTGIVPGAGVGNTRKELSEKTLNIPVIAVGIPTVVESAVLVNDCLNLFITKLQEEAKSNEYLNQLKELSK